MNSLFFFTSLYGMLHNYGCMPMRVLSPFRRFVRIIANRYLPQYLNKKTIYKGRKENNLIVSLTSFPSRIEDVWMVIESLKRQSVLPEKIILWLSKEQFHSKTDLPKSLLDREDSLFMIRMVDDDIRSHKKYYYVLSEYPDKTFITCDDDVFYHPDMVKDLVKTSERYPKCIIANVSSEMTYSNNGVLLPYVQWKNNYKAFASNNRVQIGIGGVLYPPQSINKLVLNKDLFLKLAPFADDLWLSLMARLNQTPVVQCPHNRLSLPIVNDSPSLSIVNNGEKNMNDIQIQQMRDWLKRENLPDVYDYTYHVGLSN